MEQCGENGIDESSCLSKSCCWKENQSESGFSCFRPSNTLSCADLGGRCRNPGSLEVSECNRGFHEDICVGEDICCVGCYTDMCFAEEKQWETFDGECREAGGVGLEKYMVDPAVESV